MNSSQIVMEYKYRSAMVEDNEIKKNGCPNVMDYAVEVENFSYSYKRARNNTNQHSSYRSVLKDINLVIKKNEKVSIIGPNGAGKSTLLLNIAGLLDSNDGFTSDNKGKILIFGKQMNAKNLFEIREKIGFVFQNPDDQLFSTSVYEDVSFGMINMLRRRKDSRVRDKDYIKSVVEKCLKMVNLSGMEEEIPHFLSFGEKKMCALATVLSYEPDIFILDEPSSNLDPKNRNDFINLIKSLDKTVIISTHDMDLAYNFSDRSIILYKGRIVYDGEAKYILRNKEFLESVGLDTPLSLKKIPSF